MWIASRWASKGLASLDVRPLLAPAWIVGDNEELAKRRIPWKAKGISCFNNRGLMECFPQMMPSDVRVKLFVRMEEGWPFEAICVEIDTVNGTQGSHVKRILD